MADTRIAGTGDDVHSEAVDESSRDDWAKEQAEYARLLRRYKQLSWSSSAKDQRERTELKHQLMKLHISLHPDSAYRQWDDFDVVMREKRQPTV